MPLVPEKRSVAVLTACMRSDGLPAFVRTDVAVSEEEAENGIHYYLAEAQVLEQGYEEPMVHFAESEADAFLLPGVQDFLGVSSVKPNLALQS